MKYVIDIYQTEKGGLPFNDWLVGLADIVARQKIRARLGRLELGNFGNCESVATGIAELKIDFGPGYRLYYAKTGKTIVLLLCAGTKRTQAKDIEKAKIYFADYKMRGKTNAKK